MGLFEDHVLLVEEVRFNTIRVHEQEGEEDGSHIQVYPREVGRETVFDLELSHAALAEICAVALKIPEVQELMKR